MPKSMPIERHTLAVVVDNEAGVLARVIGLFSSRGYNIESLTVAEVGEYSPETGAKPAGTETPDERSLSRITIVTSGTPSVIDQIKAQLERLVPVHRVSDLTTEAPHVEREMALLKVVGKGEQRVEALRIADLFRARVVDTTIGSFVFEVTGTTEKVNTFIGLMRELGLVEVARTGVAAIARGAQAL
jgi:acetolactate synthase I/III small subunit